MHGRLWRAAAEAKVVVMVPDLVLPYPISAAMQCLSAVTLHRRRAIANVWRKVETTTGMGRSRQRLLGVGLPKEDWLSTRRMAGGGWPTRRMQSMAQRLVVELPRGSCRGTEEHDRQREASKARGECAAEAVRLTRRLERCGGEPVGVGACQA
ncbi:hypothetical protein OsJ_08166 [Oryza sativa Japonica Group]|uniref:Uncharacterized protein n=1 Tax=Oryza sativa subsp. japonica TaxID=39947 RepID=B9F2E1_ORYSJ|nr:hypothetical protein OsJ_08166 [Oryza sativa Japonica Group]